MMQGKTINGFELKSLLGMGGMAEVWLAQNRIGKMAAVKLLLPRLCSDQTVISRFYTEAKVMVDLNHPNIRQVYDFGDIDGRPAIVMEYLNGDDLKTRMKRGQRFTNDELIRWWNQLVSALNYTHQKGVVHRDIKPGNIFVDNEGNIKLLDFGIAKVKESISATQTGQKLGTLMYMSPEQVKDSKNIDYRTDTYSLAVSFVHLITGKKPYNSDTTSDYEIMTNIVTQPLDLTGLPTEWCQFLLPYLAKDPKDRPALRPFAQNAFGVGFGNQNQFQGNQGFQRGQGYQGNQGYQRAQGYQGDQMTQGYQTNPGTPGYGNQGYQGGYQNNQGNRANQFYQGNQGNQFNQVNPYQQPVQGNPGILNSRAKNEIEELCAQKKYKDAYNKCLNLVKNNTEVEYANKKIDELVPLMQQDNKKKSRKGCIIWVIIIIILNIISFLISIS